MARRPALTICAVPATAHINANRVQNGVLPTTAVAFPRCVLFQRRVISIPPLPSDSGSI